MFNQASFLLWTRIIGIICVAATATPAVECVRLDESNWDQYVPAGKEVDCIYGDYLLRSDRLVAVIANPAATRNANLTVHNVGSSVIDLTLRDESNDQLSAFYPGAGRYEYRAPVEFTAEAAASGTTGGDVVLRCQAASAEGLPEVELVYRLRDGQPFLEVETTYTNRAAQPLRVDLHDAIRADRSFQFGSDEGLNLFWAHDLWWRQAYGVMVEGYQVQAVGDTLQRGRPVIAYARNGQSQIELKPGESFTLSRKLFAAPHLLQLLAAAHQARGTRTTPVQLAVVDADGPVVGAQVEAISGDVPYGSGRTDERGEIHFALPPGQYRAEVAALGRPKVSVTLLPAEKSRYVVQLERPGYVDAQITSEAGGPLPCKVQFRGRDGTPDPYFGPDTEVYGVHNLQYTPNGRFVTAIAPGMYDVIISYGNEYDAVFQQIEVERGSTATVRAALRRTVDTTGWISSDFHSHSSPSGDNTSSQLGRVLNLLCEHIEFAPCTEHNRISTYVPHLATLGAEKLMATCSGIELTGSPLPVNHQNAFPLIFRPHTQDGGAPTTDENPIVQIERLALWDNRSDKLVQGNHPNIPQILGDRDVDGNPDGGFEPMFGFMDVIEVHPPQSIFTPPEPSAAVRDRANAIFNWMQLLNLGYRIPGVVNTDAHYTFHGSGWLRNYLKSPTDDPSQVNTMDMVHAAEQGHLVMTTGPFLEVTLVCTVGAQTETALPGDEVVAPEGGSMELDVRVQCANWLDINRVQVFLNGRPVDYLNFTRRSTPEAFGTGVVKFNRRIPLSLERDTHIIVAAAGEGLSLSPVMGNDHVDDIPIAVANPIFVDVDGNGFQPNGDLLDRPLPK